jgi:hypothetical protein
MIKLGDAFTAFCAKDGRILIYNTPANDPLSSVFADLGLTKPEVLCSTGVDGQFIELESHGWEEYKGNEQHSFKVKSNGQIHVIRREGDKLYWDKSTTFTKLEKLPKVKSVLRRPTNREVMFCFQMPDGRFIVVTQEEQNHRYTNRMFMGDGRTMEELMKVDVDNCIGERDTTHVYSDAGQVSIYYNKYRGRKPTDNIGEIYWTPKGPWSSWGYEEMDRIKLKLLTSKQCSVDLGVDGKVRSVKRA